MRVRVSSIANGVGIVSVGADPGSPTTSMPSMLFDTGTGSRLGVGVGSALGVAAADHWSETTSALFAEAAYHRHADPLDRVLAYVDFRKGLIAGGVPDFTCLVGTMVQETYETAPEIRDACDRSISGHAATLVADIEAAMAERGMVATGWTAQSLALHTQAVLQGAFILAKAKGGAEVAKDSVDHLRRYIELLFGRVPAGQPARSSANA